MRRFALLALIFVMSVPFASFGAGAPVPNEDEPIYQGRNAAEWIADLKGTASERTSAAAALAVFGPKKESVSALADALEGNLNRVVLRAAQTLGQFGPPARDALPALRAVFKRLSDAPPSPMDDSLDRTRRAVAEAVIRIDDHPASDFAVFLVEALKSDDSEKRRDIIIRLGKLGPDAAAMTVPALIGILKETEEAAEAARQSSGSIVGPPGSESASTMPTYGSPSGTASTEKTKEIRLEAIKSLGRIGPAARAAVPALMMAMKVAAPVQTPVMGQMRIDESKGNAQRKVETISFTFASGDKTTLVACAEAIGRIRGEPKGIVSALRPALRDLDEGVRWAALCALLECGHDVSEVVPILLNFAGDKQAAVRRLAVEVLGKSKADARAVLPALTARLKDDDPSVREAAARALGDMANRAKASAPALIAALRDANAEVRREAAESLGEIGATDTDAIAALIAALRDKEGTVVGAAGMALAGLGDKGKAGIAALLDLTRAADAEQRGRACILLGFFGPAAKEAIPTLDKQSQDDANEGVRLAALSGLAKIDSTRLKNTVRLLIAALESKSEEVRGAAVECLDCLGPDARDALPALRALKERSNDIGLSVSLHRVLEDIEKAKK